MATNPWFNRYGTQSELQLQNNLLIEMIKIKGMDVIYLPRILISQDDILNEVISSYHTRGIVVEMLLESFEDYEQNGMEFSSFGLMQIPNQAVFHVSGDRFREEVDQSRLAFGERPNEGDILYAMPMRQFFTVKKVNKDDPTKTMIGDRWILRCEKMDDANNINIALDDYTEETGMVDHRLETGFGDHFGVTDMANEFIAELEKADPIYFDPDMPAKEVCELAEEKKIEAIKNSSEERLEKNNKDAADNKAIASWFDNNIFADDYNDKTNPKL